MSPVLEFGKPVKYAGSIAITKLKQNKYDNLEAYILKQMSGEIVAKYEKLSEPF
mgnify:CR=1 FL=1